MSIHIAWCWRCWDTWIQEIKAMSKVWKIFYRFPSIKCYVYQRCQRWCLRLLCNTTYRVLLLILLMSKVLKMSITMYCTLYTGPLTPPGGKACTAFCLVDLAVHHQSVQGGSFVNFLGLVNYKGVAGKMHSQSAILKLIMGALSNLVILTYLWEQSCILHTLNKLPA